MEVHKTGHFFLSPPAPAPDPVAGDGLGSSVCDTCGDWRQNHLGALAGWLVDTVQLCARCSLVLVGTAWYWMVLVGAARYWLVLLGTGCCCKVQLCGRCWLVLPKKPPTPF